MSVGERRVTGAGAAAAPVEEAVRRKEEEEEVVDDGCGRGDNSARLRWAVNIDKWHPEGDHEGEEFQFLLSLLPSNERADCLKMMFMPDKKRALVSRLLQRAACSRVTSVPHAEVRINRTKGRKPFMVRDFDNNDTTTTTVHLPHAPNFNFNVSHEGDFVVLASEPSAICGVDVAAPGQARRRGKDGRMPTAEEMLQTFSDVFTPHEKEQIRAAGTPGGEGGGGSDDEEDDNAKEEVFRRHWSLKESLVKAMGVGLALELGRAEFHTGGVAGGGGGGGGEGSAGGGEGSAGGEGEEEGGGVSRRTSDGSDGSIGGGGGGGGGGGDDDDDDETVEHATAKPTKMRRNSLRRSLLMFGASMKRVFVSDGGGDHEPTAAAAVGAAAVGVGNGGMETARLILDGSPKPKWRFFMQPLGESKAARPGESGGGQHWVTVSRGPTEDVTDANGEFSASWRKPTFTEEEWEAVLNAPSPFFSLLSVGDLVPEHLKGAYEEAGGDVFCEV